MELAIGIGAGMVLGIAASALFALLVAGRDPLTQRVEAMLSLLESQTVTHDPAVWITGMKSTDWEWVGEREDRDA